MKSLVVKKRASKMLADGAYKGIISLAVLVESKVVPQWVDRTQQIESDLKTDAGTVKLWTNTIGFQSMYDAKFADKGITVAPKGFEFRSSINEKTGLSNEENYLVNVKTNRRVESDEKSDKCSEILAEYLADAGIEEGTDFEGEDGTVDLGAVCEALIGQPIGIIVKHDGEKIKVYTRNVNKIKTEVEVED